MRKILTISIAAYNMEKYISQCLESLCDEGIIEDLEIFVIDDGGTDRTLEIAKRFSDKYPGSIILVHKNNGGWGSTINYSIAHATGKYFKILDGDDFFSTEHLRDFLLKLKEGDADVVYTPFIKYFEVSDKYIETGKNLTKAGNLQLIENCNFEFAMHGCTFKTKILQSNNVRISEHCFYTDNEYVIKSLTFCRNVVYYNIPIYVYRIGRTGQSVSLKSIRKNIKDIYKVNKNLINCQKKYNIDLIDKLIFVYEQFAYNSILLAFDKKSLIEYDKWLEKSSIKYSKINSRLVKLMRDANYKLYYPIKFYKKIRYKIDNS